MGKQTDTQTDRWGKKKGGDEIVERGKEAANAAKCTYVLARGPSVEGKQTHRQMGDDEIVGRGKRPCAGPGTGRQKR